MTQWHHFAYMIISIALLGFGASGTCISLFRNTLKRHFSGCYRLFACAFPLSIVLSYLLSQRNPFNPFEVLWDSRQYLHLTEYYLILFVPFLCAALCFGLAFSTYPQRIGLLYCCNLIGSGAGTLGTMVLLHWLHPVLILYVITGLACCGAYGARASCPLHLCGQDARASKWGYFLIGLIVILAVMFDPLALRDRLTVSQYKGLSMARHFPDADILTERVSPLGVVHAVASPLIRNAPGLSLNYTGDIPSQIGLYIDFGNAGVITQAPSHDSLPEEDDTAFLDSLSASLAYHIRPVRRVLVLGAGGGMDVMNALYHEAESVDAVELDPHILDLVRHEYQDFSGGVYSRPNVQTFNQEARGFISTTQTSYDAIHLSLMDAFAASSAGVYALHEHYLYTMEAFQQYYQRLSPQGMMSITRWVKFPPRENIKLFATAAQALRNLRVPDIDRHLVWIRSWATSTLLVSKSPLDTQEIERVKQFCRERAFDTTYFPGMTAEEANLYNQLPSPRYFEAAQQVLFDDPESLYRSYPYFIRPARDNSPYFFHGFKWERLPVLLDTLGTEWIPFVEWGYLVLLATLLQAAVLSLLLILLPLGFLRRRHASTRIRRLPNSWYLFTVLYFTCLGLGYLFLEMVCIQKFLLFLAAPAVSASVVIASFLIFSGCGSLYSEFRNVSLPAAVAGILLCAAGYATLFPVLFTACAHWNGIAKILLTVVLIAPAAFCMGIPFPYGLRLLNRQADDLIPWAYGINGCASVLSSLLATMLAISCGFQTVILCAAVLYALAALAVYGVSHSS